MTYCLQYVVLLFLHSYWFHQSYGFKSLCCQYICQKAVSGNQLVHVLDGEKCLGMKLALDICFVECCFLIFCIVRFFSCSYSLPAKFTSQLTNLDFELWNLQTNSNDILLWKANTYFAGLNWWICAISYIAETS